ncbi:YhdP family protein [Thalassotalea agariperforans]
MKLATALHYSLRWLYKSIAILLVVFAVLLSCLRLFLPYAENYRDDLQNHINSTYQTNIIIGSLNSGWTANGPTLLAKNISLLNANGVKIFVGNFEVELDFWQTLLHRQLITTNFNLENTKIYFDPTRFEKLKKSEKDRVVLDKLYNLFLTQIPRFTIRDSQVQIQFSSATRTLFISELAWLNEGKAHRGKGEVIVDGLSTNKLSLLVDLEGKNKDELDGQAYFEANNINITPWIEQFLAIEDDKTDSAINFQTWLKIDKGYAEQLIVKFGDNHISWQEDEQKQAVDEAHKLTINDGYFVIQATEKASQFRYYSSPIKWQVNDKPQQYIKFNGAMTYQQVSGYVSRLDVESIVALNPLFITKPELQDMLLSLAPQGEFHDIQFNYHDTFSLVSQFSRVTTQNFNSIPSIENLSGTLAYQEGKALLNLSAQDGHLDFGRHFKWPIPYQAITADILLTFDQGILAKVSDINLVSPELSLEGELVVNVPNDDDASMALLAYVDKGKAEFAKHYYPHLLMGDDLVNYLERAITDGELNNAEIVFDGYFNDFPFTDKPGIFYVDAQLENSNFVFDKNWPAIENLNANLNFTNNSMMITAHSGSLKGLNVNGVQVGIASLSDNQILTVDAKINQQKPAHISALMNASPLADSVGTVLNTAVFSHPISGEFSLDLPLDDADKAIAKGKINFSNNDLHLQTPDMQFANLYGELSFNNDIIKVNNIAANWRGMPMNFSVAAQNEALLYRTDIQFSGDWLKELWKIEIPEPIQKYLDGSLNWQGNLALLIPHGSDELAYQLELSAALDDNRLNLPAPYTKAENMPLSLQASVTGDNDLSRIQANLADNLSFYGELSHQQTAFTRAHLVLGSEKMMLPLDGFHISASLEEADVGEWQPFIGDILASLPNSDNKTPNQQVLIEQPERIRASIKQLNFLDESFNDVSLNMLAQKNWWLLEVNAKELRSQIKLYPDYDEQGLDINIDFLNIAEQPIPEVLEELTQELSPTANNKTAHSNEKPASKNVATTSFTALDHANNQTIFNSLPPIKFNCESCKIGSFDFGTVAFEIAKSSEQLMLLKNFSAKRKGFEARLAGQWLMQDDYSSSQLAGNIQIKNIEAEMDKMSFDSIIKDSGAELKFDINWLGGLQDFSTHNLNGEIHSVIDDGYLADVSDQARIFSILSLQSLVRKLTLDFRDVFSDGMFYSEIKGDSTIENGVIYTDNMKMKGSAGDLLVQGNTNLVSGQLDYRMSYKPNLTSSLPVLGWIATLNPVAIIAGVAIDEVITSNVVSEFTFELTGSIDEPNLKEVNRKSQNISVGRSTPPKVVEEPIEAEASDTKITPLKQYTPIYENNDG